MMDLEHEMDIFPSFLSCFLSFFFSKRAQEMNT